MPIADTGHDGSATLTIEHPRCVHCRGEVAPHHRSVCPDCGAMLHARCYVAAGGCPTPGCVNAAEGLVRPAPTALVLDAARPRGVHDTVAVGGVACGTAGAIGMVLSALVMTGGMQAVVVGVFGFVAGALLVAAGLIVTTLAALRPPAPGALPVVAGVLAALSLAAGIGGMGLSFLFLALGTMVDVVGGGGGFVAGAVLVLGGAVSSALLALRREH